MLSCVKFVLSTLNIIKNQSKFKERGGFMKKFIVFLMIVSFLSFTLAGCEGKINPVDKNNKIRFVRISEKGVVGGVCAGVAYYFGINVIIVRIVWTVAILGFGAGVIAYIVCWVLMPDSTYIPADYNKRTGGG